MLQGKSMPVAPKERVIALDFLRGFTLLGILLMNIQGFLPSQMQLFSIQPPMMI